MTDRGPVTRGRIIDLSVAAAKALDMRRDGVVMVRLEPVAASAASVSPAVDSAAAARLLPQTARS